MKVAILYTGALRTIKKTIRYFKSNLLNQVPVPDYEISIFACIQNDTVINNDNLQTWLVSELGERLKSIEWFNQKSEIFTMLTNDYLLRDLRIPEHFNNYLKNSGSIIEHFQMQKAYMKLVTHERAHGLKYDYIVRLRTDTIFGKPIDFHWLHWTKEQVSLRVERIRHVLNDLKIESSSENILKYFMQTILCDDLIENIKNLNGKFIQHKEVKIPTVDEEIYDYLKNGRFILTFRKNLLYIVRRELFYLIPTLGTFYGYQDCHFLEPDWFWNSESQFQATCYNSFLNIHDYTTEFDEKSLYEFDESRYFDEHYNLINKYMVYCLVRY